MRVSPLWLKVTRGHALAELALVAFASLAGAVAQGQAVAEAGGAGRYVLAPQRSSVTFYADFFSHSQISMRFHRLSAQLEGAQSLDSGRVVVTIDAASVEARPRFLSSIIRGGGMLDVVRYPEIRFVSTRFVRSGEGGGWLFGDLTIKDITRPVSLLVTLGGAVGSPPLDSTLAFAVAGEVSRREFGFSAWFPTVGDAVHLRMQVEFVREP